MGIKYVSEYLILNIFFFYIIIRFMAIFFVDDREEKKDKNAHIYIFVSN